MRFRLPTLLPALACLALCLVLAAPAVHAQAAPAATQTGTLSGSVVNGSHNNAPVAGQTVTLNVYVGHATPQEVAHTTTDTHGAFTFTGLDGAGASTYELVTSYQGGQFSSGALTLANGGAVAMLVVYDTTTNDAAVSLDLVTVLFSAPDTQAGKIPVGEFVTFDNTGTKAFVATPGMENGKPTGLLRFALPSGVSGITLGAGFEGAQTVSVGSAFASTGTLPPGKTQMAFAFQVPYSGTDYVYSYHAQYATAQVALLVPFDMQIEARDFAAQQPVEATGQKFHLLTKDTVAADATASTRLWGLPEAGEPPDLGLPQLIAVGAGLALLLALAVGLFLRRGNLALAFGLVPAALHAVRSSSTATSGTGEAERKRLLADLLALDTAHAAGTVSEVDYQHRRAALRSELRTLLAASAGAAPRAATSPASPAPLHAEAVEVSEPVPVSSGDALPRATETDEPNMSARTPRPRRPVSGGTR